MSAPMKQGARLTFRVVALAAGALLAACARRPPAPGGGATTGVAPAPASPAADLAAMRDAALATIAKAKVAPLAEVARAVSLPSIERLVEDADARRAHLTNVERDLDFARRAYQTARGHADVLLGGEDPYDYARGAMVKAYRSEWDGTLQPYALYVPRDYDGRRAFPLVVALHGAGSDHRHMLRRVFGLDNRPGEGDEEASRNELPLPEVPARSSSRPSGRGEVMGYDGLGEEDVLRVLADVRRAYKIDPERISLTGLSMGGGGTWTIGLRHPELFAALAPVCGVTDVRKWIAPDERAFYDERALEALSPPAFAENARACASSFSTATPIPVVPVADSRRMAARFKAPRLAGQDGELHGVPGRRSPRLGARLRGRRAPAHARGRPQGFPRRPRPRPGPSPRGAPCPRSSARARRASGPTSTSTARTARPRRSRRRARSRGALADWGPGVSARFAVKVGLRGHGRGEGAARPRARRRRALERAREVLQERLGRRPPTASSRPAPSRRTTTCSSWAR